MLKNVRAPSGIPPLIPINLRNAAAQCPSFLRGNQIPLSLPVSGIFLTFSSFSLHQSAFFFHLFSAFTKLFESVLLPLPPLCSAECVILSKHRSLLWNYSRFNCALSLQNLLCHFLCLSFSFLNNKIYSS